MSHILVRYEEGNRLEIRKRRKERVNEMHEYTDQYGERLKAVVLNSARLENLKRKKLEMENEERISVTDGERRPTKKREERPRRREEEEEKEKEEEKEEEEEEDKDESEDEDYRPSSEDEEWNPVRKQSTRSSRTTKKQVSTSGRKEEETEEKPRRKEEEEKKEEEEEEKEEEEDKDEGEAEDYRPSSEDEEWSPVRKKSRKSTMNKESRRKTVSNNKKQVSTSGRKEEETVERPRRREEEEEKKKEEEKEEEEEDKDEGEDEDYRPSSEDEEWNPVRKQSGSTSRTTKKQVSTSGRKEEETEERPRRKEEKEKKEEEEEEKEEEEEEDKVESEDEDYRPSSEDEEWKPVRKQSRRSTMNNESRRTTVSNNKKQVSTSGRKEEETEERPQRKEEEEKKKEQEEEKEEEKDEDYRPSSEDEEWTLVRKQSRRSSRTTKKQVSASERKEEETEERPRRKKEKEEKEEEKEEEEDEGEDEDYTPSSEDEEWNPVRKQSRRTTKEQVSTSGRKGEETEERDSDDDDDDDDDDEDHEDEDGKSKVKRKDRRTKHYCLFCTKMVARMKRHHTSAHANEPQVQAVLATQENDQKTLKWNILVAKGDSVYNKKVLEGQGGALITAQERKNKWSTKKMVQCEKCWTTIKPRSMAAHRRSCSQKGKSEEQPPNLLKDLKDDGYYEEVIRDMKFGFPDVVLRKKSYYSFGKYLWKEKGYKNAREVQQKLRYLRSLEEEIQVEEEDGEKKRNKKTEKREVELRELLQPKWVDLIVATIKRICGFERKDRKLEIKFPSKVLKLIPLVVEVANHERVNCLKRGEETKAKQIGHFLSVFESETDKPLRRVARQHLGKPGGKKVEDLPTVENVWVITRHLEEEAPGLLKNLREKPEEATWMLLRDNLVIWTGLFNRRRGGAAEKLKLADYYRARKVSDKDLERVRNASEAEMEFLKSLRVARIHHKLHEVNLFIPKMLQEAIQTLVAYRWAAGIIEENEYVFAAGVGSRQPVRATNVFSKYKNLLPPESREKMTFTNLRKQGATLVRVLDLDSDDLENWALHMGHSRRIEERYYALKGDPESILKTGKMLSLLRNGSLKENVGKKLDDIRMDLDTSLPTPEKNIGPDDVGSTRAEEEAAAPEEEEEIRRRCFAGDSPSLLFPTTDIDPVPSGPPVPENESSTSS